jgi:hypothetical protein
VNKSSLEFESINTLELYGSEHRISGDPWSFPNWSKRTSFFTFCFIEAFYLLLWNVFQISSQYSNLCKDKGSVWFLTFALIKPKLTI